MTNEPIIRIKPPLDGREAYSLCREDDGRFRLSLAVAGTSAGVKRPVPTERILNGRCRLRAVDQDLFYYLKERKQYILLEGHYCPETDELTVETASIHVVPDEVASVSDTPSPAIIQRLEELARLTLRSARSASWPACVPVMPPEPEKEEREPVHHQPQPLQTSAPLLSDYDRQGGYQIFE